MQFLRKVTKLPTRPEPVAATPLRRREGHTPAAKTGDGPAKTMTADALSPPPPTVADGPAKPPRPRGRPRLDSGEDRKPMGHRVPAALLRQLTLIAAELAYLEDRKIQQQDLVASALEEFIARQKIRIDQLRRQRSE